MLYGSSVAVIAVFMVQEFMLYCIHTVRVPAPRCTQVDLVAFIVFSHLLSDAQISVRGHIRETRGGGIQKFTSCLGFLGVFFPLLPPEE